MIHCNRNYLVRFGALLAFVLALVIGNDVIGSPIRSPLGGGGPGTNSSTWTPEQAPTLPTFDLDPNVASTLTLSGSTITAATSVASGPYTLVQVGSTALPVIDRVDTIGSYPTIVTTASGGESLFSPSGPPAGSDIGQSLYAVAELYSTNSFPAILTVGSPTGVANEAIFLGARVPQWWAGAQTSPVGAIGGTTDNNPHLFESHYNPSTGKFDLRVDGLLLATTASGAFSASTGGFPVGFGIAVQGSGFNGNVRLARGIYRLGGLDPPSVRVQHEVYLGKRYGLSLPPLVAAQGDSLTYGDATDNYPTVPQNPAHSWIAQLSSQSGMAIFGSFTAFNDGHPGDTSADLILDQTSTGQASALRKQNIAVIWIGTNDFGTGSITPSVPLATWQANVLALYNADLAAGYQGVVVCTFFPWINWNDADFEPFNAWIRATFPHVADLAADARFTSGLSITTGLWSGVYDDVYRTRSGGAAGHLTQLGEGVAASIIAPAVISLRQ